MTEWTPEEDEINSNLFYQGKSAEERAESLPGRTRNACIGRTSRLGLNDLPQPPPPPVRKPVPTFSLTPSEFATQCAHMEEERCNLTRQPGHDLCATHLP